MVGFYEKGESQKEAPIIEGRFYRVKPCPHGYGPGYCMEHSCEYRPSCVKDGVFADNSAEVRSEILRCRGPTVDEGRE